MSARMEPVIIGASAREYILALLTERSAMLPWTDEIETLSIGTWCGSS